jgi:5-methylcytosine-specific restriction endonuclease McrA
MDKRSKTCRKCVADRTVTLGDCCKRYEKHHPSSKGVLVRNRARKKYGTDESSCQNCGYSNHVEVCHIKPIHSFDLSTLIDDINSPDNILVLCPNCHWEFDHGRLTVDKIGYPGNAPGLSL